MKNIKNSGILGFLAIVAVSVVEKMLMDRATKQISTETTLEILQHFNMIEKKDNPQKEHTP